MVKKLFKVSNNINKFIKIFDYLKISLKIAARR